ncbi:MAG: hypothetical protein R3299_10940 [Arenibacter sp.]|uniref:hypothetical protein n=1 Tax=Arenibacter TaxID=178469 RepID=UPI000A392B18|nr:MULTISPECIES: hypothetical protein [Arenibacter]MDX1328208.1 hypothetical protein [Arenibacter sp.]
MKNEFAQNEKEIIDRYEKKGYTQSYSLTNGQLMDLESKKKYAPKDVHIIAEHRFEGMTNPSDMSILYVVETKNEGKGTVLVNYNPSKSTEMALFFKEIPKENYRDQA